MPSVSSKADGAVLYYRDYKPSKHPFQPKANDQDGHQGRTQDLTLVFTAAWPFSSKMYDHLLVPLSQSYGYRCIAIDRRGYGKSEWSGPRKHDIDYDTFAEDLCQILTICDIKEFVGIGASLGCGEFLLALSKNSDLHCRGLVFLGPSLPIPLETERKPGPPRTFWDKLLLDLRSDRYKTLTEALPYIWGEAGAKKLSTFESARYEEIAMSSDPIALEQTVQIFLARDFTDFLEEHAKIYNFSILVLHGNVDAANPVESGPGFLKKILPDVEIRIYEDSAHGIAATHKEECLIDIVDFLNSNRI